MISSTMSSLKEVFGGGDGLVAESCPTLRPHVATPCSHVHGISRQECWSGLPFPSQQDLPNPGIEPQFFTTEPPGIV